MKKPDLNKMSIEEIIAFTEEMDMPFESKRTLISNFYFNENPNNLNPLLDQYPLDLTNNRGEFVKDLIINIVDILKRQSGLIDIYGGYVLVESPFNSFSQIGATSLVAMNIERIKNDIDAGKKIILGYIAIPINDVDNLIENQSINDWEFQERYLDPLLNCGTIPAGAIGLGAIGRKGEEGKLRTLKFTLDVNSAVR
jgi:hypothetical protein